VDILLPGNYGADALASLLSGEANFSGKLPFTYPKHTNKFAVYDYKPSENQGTMAGVYNYNAVMDVQWPFGYGLSYTTFAYSNAKADKAEMTADQTLKVSVDVTNTGAVDGAEVVQLYINDVKSTIDRPVKELKNFEKVWLKAGETKTVTFEIDAEDLSYFDADKHEWVAEPGKFKVLLGSSSEDVRSTVNFKLN
jgi:beta-glucosidase